MMDITYRNVINKAVFTYNDWFGRYFGRSMIFITTEQLIAWSREWHSTLPTFDLLVGNPRSGMIPAVALSEFGTPFTTPSSLEGGVAYSYSPLGFREMVDAIVGGCSDEDLEDLVRRLFPRAGTDSWRKAILLDDTINTGSKALPVLEKVRGSGLEISFGAVVASKEFDPIPGSLYYKTLLRNRLGEWNLSHANFGRVVSDMDGVLCQDPPAEGYDEWIQDPKARFIPSGRIDTIFTARLERYRPVTEKWLESHGVKYERLVMGIPIEDRIREISRMRPRPDLVLESDVSHAERIWKGTSIPVLCFDAKKIYCR